jgi:hypothetical protein
MRRSTSCPVWVMPVTGCSAQVDTGNAAPLQEAEVKDEIQ